MVIRQELEELLSGGGGGGCVDGGDAASGAAAPAASGAAAPATSAAAVPAASGTAAAPSDGFSVYRSPVVARGSWSDFQLYAHCRRNEAHCARCPRTAAVLAAQPSLNTMAFGAHFFSRLTGGTHLAAHCGPSNLRLRVHLGLIVPPGTRIRCGDQTREWKEGECLVFDDSFEHEVWHEGAADRIVLIADMYHPDVDLEAMVLPLLGPEQRADLAAAQRGEHTALTARGYSTGEVVAVQR